MRGDIKDSGAGDEERLGRKKIFHKSKALRVVLQTRTPGGVIPSVIGIMDNAQKADRGAGFDFPRRLAVRMGKDDKPFIS